MVEYIKGIFGFSNSLKKIPEIVLIKNEAKHYYDNSLNKWVFEGEDDYMKDKKEQISFPPSKTKSYKKAKDSDKNGTSKRYKNVLHQDNIVQSPQEANGEMKTMVEGAKKLKEQEITIKTLRKELSELNDLLPITDDKCIQNQNYYKEELNRYVKENINLRAVITNIDQQLQEKNNEINQYKKLIDQYQELFNAKTEPEQQSAKAMKFSNSNDDHKQMLLIEDNDQSFTLNKERTDLLVNSKLEKLKSENMFLSNDIKKLLTDNLNYQSINSALGIELASLKADIHFKQKQIGLLEAKIFDHHSNSYESKGLISKMNQLTGENILLKSQMEKLKAKLDKAKSQLDTSRMEYNEIVELKAELLAKQMKLTDYSTEVMNIWAFIKNESTQFSNDETIGPLLSSDPSIMNISPLLKYLFKLIPQGRSELALVIEREGYLKEENDNYQLEIEIMKDQLKESNSELLGNKELLTDSNEAIKEVTKTNKELNLKINEMMNILTQTQNEYKKETYNKIMLENEMKLLKQSNYKLNQNPNSGSNSDNSILSNNFNQSHVTLKSKLNKK